MPIPLSGFCDCSLPGCGFKHNTTSCCQNPGEKKCNSQVSRVNVSHTASFFWKLELIFRESLIKQLEDHDTKIFQAVTPCSSYCSELHTSPPRGTTGWAELYPHRQVQRLTPEPSETDSAEIMQNFCMGMTDPAS